MMFVMRGQTKQIRASRDAGHGADSVIGNMAVTQQCAGIVAEASAYVAVGRQQSRRQSPPNETSQDVASVSRILAGLVNIPSSS